MLAFFAQTAPCRVGMEACGSSHYWARPGVSTMRFWIPPAYTKPYVKRGKNDATMRRADSERAMSRPKMRFVPIKSADQQAADACTRPGIVGQTANHDRQRATRVSVEFGPIAPKASNGLAELLKPARRRPFPKRPVLLAMLASLAMASTKGSTTLRKIARQREKPDKSLWMKSRLSGLVIASAMVAFNLDPSVFRSDGDCARRWHYPSQNSAGGGAIKSGGITEGQPISGKMLSGA